MSNLRIITSSSLSSLNFSALYSRFFLDSRPSTLLAAAQRSLPASVIGPDPDPCILHTRLPTSDAFLHCCLLRFDNAWHLGARVPLNNSM